MKTQSKVRKKAFTDEEQACHHVRGFKKLYEERYDKVRFSGHSASTLFNYARILQSPEKKPVSIVPHIPETIIIACFYFRISKSAFCFQVQLFLLLI